MVIIMVFHKLILKQSEINFLEKLKLMWILDVIGMCRFVIYNGIYYIRGVLESQKREVSN